MKRVALLLLSGIFAGCLNVRYVAIPNVEDIGQDIATQYRYRLAGYKVGAKSVAYAGIKADLERFYPNVFANNGIPIVIQEVGSTNFSAKYHWTILFPYLVSFGTLPMIKHSEHDTIFAIAFKDQGYIQSKYEINIALDKALTCYTPFALLCYNNPPETHGHRAFYRVKAYGGDTERIQVNRLAIGYGAAVRLKELETAGKIDPLKRKPKIQPVARPSDKPESVKQPSRMNSAISPSAVPVSKETQEGAANPIGPVPVVSKPVQMFDVENISL